MILICYPGVNEVNDPIILIHKQSGYGIVKGLSFVSMLVNPFLFSNKISSRCRCGLEFHPRDTGFRIIMKMKL